MENKKSIISVEHTLLELFSGIGGFAHGLQNAGFQFEKHYYSEIDKHAIANYKHNFRNAEYIGSVQDVSGRNIKPTIITFGSPCQDFSLAGKRKGMEGQRSSLILHAIRLIRECKPHLFIWENVKGAFSSNNGEDFWGIIRAFTNIGGYRLEWQLLNTSWFLPQNRERIYLIGHLAGRSEPRVFPITKGYKWNDSINGTKSDSRERLLSNAIDSNYHKGADGKRTMILISDSGLHRQWKEEKIVPPLRANTGAGHGNLLKIKGRLNKSQDGKINNEEAMVQTLNEGHYNVPKIIHQKGRGYNKGGEKKECPSITKNSFEHNNHVFLSEPMHKHGEQRIYTGDAPTIQSRYGTLSPPVPYVNNIRRLTEIECERLQGYADDWTKFGNYDGEIKKISKTQRYKLLGNAVSVPVVEAIGKLLL